MLARGICTVVCRREGGREGGGRNRIDHFFLPCSGWMTIFSYCLRVYVLIVCTCALPTVWLHRHSAVFSNLKWNTVSKSDSFSFLSRSSPASFFSLLLSPFLLFVPLLYTACDVSCVLDSFTYVQPYRHYHIYLLSYLCTPGSRLTSEAVLDCTFSWLLTYSYFWSSGKLRCPELWRPFGICLNTFMVLAFTYIV